MNLKIFIVTCLLSALTISCQECNNKVNNRKIPTKPYKEIYKHNKTPLIGHIDILKHNGHDYQILIEQIVCDPSPKNKQSGQEGEFSPYVIKLEPGNYQIKLHDKLHHATYTRYITIGLKHNIE